MHPTCMAWRRRPPRAGFWHAYLRTSSTAVHQNRIFFTAGLHSRIFYFKKFDWTAPPHKFILRHFTFFSTEVFIQPTFTTAHVSTAATCHCMFLCGGDMPPHATKYGCKTDVQKSCGGIMQPHLRTAEVICHRTCQSAFALYHWTVFCGGKVPLHFPVFNCIVPRNNISADAQLHSISK